MDDSVRLPEGVVIRAEETRVTFDVVANDVHCYVFATPPAYVAPRATADVATFVPMSVSASFQGTPRYGETVPFTLRLSERLQRAATITFRDGSGAFRLPASISVPPGVTEVAAEVTLLRGGTVSAAIDLDGEPRGTMTVSVAPPEITLSPPEGVLDAATARTVTVRFALRTPLPVDLPFSIESDRARLDAPFSGVIPAGATSATFVVTARAPGRALLTVPSAANFPVTVTTTDPGMFANLPESFTHAAGDTPAWISPRVIRAGRTRITVSARGQVAWIDLVGGTPPPPERRRPSR